MNRLINCNNSPDALQTVSKHIYISVMTLDDIIWLYYFLGNTYFFGKRYDSWFSKPKPLVVILPSS